MKLFRTACLIQGKDPASDWTRVHGYTEMSEFPFPDLYLSPQMEALLDRDPSLESYLDDRLVRFAEHDYGSITSLEQVDNLSQRDILKVNTWMWALWDTPAWGKIYLYVFYDMALFFREGEAFQDILRQQRQKAMGSAQPEPGIAP